ncbi:MAG: hypothetical protein HOB84_04145 [Candidatus Marinimicrobia bacterium]|nr:hypothetical protein [Candidatus Neomarinimicrobiota bacterium]MBT4361504.1 hypothetical protein [Candidatus Neomarinimicrobiota bacterium]MBT4713942.1 hypothetical protein [Candidatus Neomarinimicrobiota bacterium]MBT4946459.1 hypothetical protein [Candidatus Neomarinimicrobiota bacterium]MBT5269549.1 hypothetical protein [Candidatus Neomarinimicrobiota bacterium]
MVFSKVIQMVLFFTILCMLSCPTEPHSEFYFEIENNGSTNVNVSYTILDSLNTDTSLVAGRWLTIHETSVGSCFEPLNDNEFAKHIELFMVIRDGDTLNVQTPGNRSEWRYVGWDNGGAISNPCGGSGHYTFLISDSLYPP